MSNDIKTFIEASITEFKTLNKNDRIKAALEIGSIIMQLVLFFGLSVMAVYELANIKKWKYMDSNLWIGLICLFYLFINLPGAVRWIIKSVLYIHNTTQEEKKHKKILKLTAFSIFLATGFFILIFKAQFVFFISLGVIIYVSIALSLSRKEYVAENQIQFNTSESDAQIEPEKREEI